MAVVSILISGELSNVLKNPFCLKEFIIPLRSFNGFPNNPIDLFAPVISSVIVLSIVL